MSGGYRRATAGLLILAALAALPTGCGDDDGGAAPLPDRDAQMQPHDAQAWPDANAPDAHPLDATLSTLDATLSTLDAADDDANALPEPALRVLVFTRTLGYRHAAIAAAIQALTAEASERNWAITFTEDGGVFDATLVDRFDVIAFVLTSGDVLESQQEQALVAFMQAGKGWVGVHSASDTEYDWPWYGALVGAYFRAHPPVQDATLRVERGAHPATEHLAATWSTRDEWYGFVTNPRDDVHVLLSLDETSYAPASSAMGDHPVAWYHRHEAGRAFYTALGHGDDSWRDPAFLAHVTGAIRWAAGMESANAIAIDADGVSAPGTWRAHTRPGGFSFDVTGDAIAMHDSGGANQHIVRDGARIDLRRPYTMEALFRVPEADDGSPLNSFCFNLGVAGEDGDLAPPSTWAINMDFSASGTGAVMKHMGFIDGGFRTIGETALPWAVKGREYLLRVDVGAMVDDVLVPSQLRATVFDAGVMQAAIDIDYATFPYQPMGSSARIGLNTHGTDWTLRGLRVYYRD